MVLRGWICQGCKLRNTSLYLELCGAAVGVLTSELLRFRLETLDSSGALAGPGATVGFSSRTRLEKRAFSTEGSPSDRFVAVMSIGFIGFFCENE